MRKTPALVLACCLGVMSTAHAQEGKADGGMPASLQSLHEAASKNSPDTGELLSLTHLCMSQGHAAEAHRVLLKAHDQTASTTTKVGIMPLLAWTAYATGTSQELLREFRVRRYARPQSALAWLEVSLVGDSQNRTQTFEYLKTAATLPADDEETADLLAGHLETERLWQEAIQVLERWPRLEDSARLTARLAILHLLVGDDQRGWALAEKVAAGTPGTAKEMQQVGEAVCHLREWEKAEALATRGLLTFPNDLGLLCLRAIALGEMGRDADAVSVYLRILQRRDDPPAGGLHFSGLSSEATRWHQGTRPPKNLPEGIEQLNLVENWSRLALVHSRNAEWDYGMRSFRLPLKLQLPGTVADARAFARAHLEELERLGAHVPRDAMKAALAEAGLARLAVLSELQAKNLSPISLGQALVQEHPDDKVVMGWWLTRREGWMKIEEGEGPVQEHCVRLFAQTHPDLAFAAAWKLAISPNPKQEEYQKKALEIFHDLSEHEPVAARQVAYSVEGWVREWPNAKDWRAAAMAVLEKGARELPEAWELDSNAPTVGLSRVESALGLLKHQAVEGRWEDFAATLNAEALRKQPVEWLVQRNPYGYWSQGALLLSDEASLSFPWIALRWPGSVTSVLEYEVYHRTRDGTYARMEKSWIEKLEDPLLRAYTHWKLDEVPKATQHIEQRIKSPEAGLADWWMAAWLALNAAKDFPDAAAEQRSTRLAAERLARAAEFPATGLLRTYLDAALLRIVLALRERPRALVEAAHAAAKRMCRNPLPTTYDQEDFKSALLHLGFSEEANAITKTRLVPHPSDPLARTPTIPSLSSTLERYRSNYLFYMEWKKPADEKEKAAMVRRALRMLHAEFPDELAWGRRLSASEWERAGLLEDVRAAAAPPPHATARRLLRAGQDFDLLGDKETACTHYEAALRAAPKLYPAQVRLTVLRHRNEPEKALTLLELLPESEVAEVIQLLGTRASASDPSEEGKAPRPLLLRWMQRLTAEGRELPQGAVMPIQQAILYQEGPPDELCRAAFAFPELAEDALGLIGGDAMKRKQPLTEAAALAREFLERQAQGKQKKRGFYALISTRSEAVPREERVQLPSPMLILIWDAWQRKAPEEVEAEILPRLRKAGPTNDDAVRAGADLFFCAPDQFLAAARRFSRSETAQRTAIGHSFTDRFFEGSTLDFVILVWHVRQLKVSLEELFFEEMSQSKESSGSGMAALTTWLVVTKAHPEQAMKLGQKVRDRLLGTDSELRRAKIRSTQERNRQGPIPERWHRMVAPPPAAVSYVSWLRNLEREPGMKDVARNLAKEDGLELSK